jgi:hypothetical protein
MSTHTRTALLDLPAGDVRAALPEPNKPVNSHQPPDSLPPAVLAAVNRALATDSATLLERSRMPHDGE